MNALTLHAMDDSLALALRKHAADLGTSINQAAKALLAGALGLTSEGKRTPPSFIRFAGGLSRKDAANLRSFVDEASFSKVDKSDWS